MSIFNANHQSNPSEHTLSPEAYDAESTAFREADASVMLVYNLKPELYAVPETPPEQPAAQPVTSDIQATYADQVADLEEYRKEQHLRLAREEVDREAA